MKITVIAKTKSKIEGVEKQLDGNYIVRVHMPPVDGEANKRISEVLAQHFKVPIRAVTLLSGAKGKRKIFQIGEG